MISEQALLVAAGRLLAMPFCPADELVKMAILDELPEIVEDDDQLRWLIARVLKLYNQWPGLSEIRAVYCSKFRPRDGVEVYSAVYPEGIPSEQPEILPALPPPRATKELTGDAKFEAELQRLAKLKQFPKR